MLTDGPGGARRRTPPSRTLHRFHAEYAWLSGPEPEADVLIEVEAGRIVSVTPEAPAGDIVALTGIPGANIGETIADVETPEALPTIAITEPTLKMTFGVNSSPFAGREGKYPTSRQLRARSCSIRAS